MDIPGWPDAFRNANRIAFDIEPDELDARWWAERVHAVTSLLPLDFAEALCARAPGSASFRYGHISRKTGSISLALEGADAGRLWLQATVLEVSNTRSLLSDVWVDPKARRRGVGKALLSNLVEMSRMLGISIVRLDARDIGGYHWAAAGFRPLSPSWRDIRDYAIRQIAYLSLDPARQAEVTRLLIEAENHPFGIQRIARLRDRVPDPMSDPMARELTTLGRAMLVGSSWTGELNLADTDQMALYEEWLRNVPN
jgi:GNAT superfamily N-acetyltransferase